MVTSLGIETSPNLQFELLVTQRKIDAVDAALLGELEKEERDWYASRRGELMFYRDRVVAELTDRGEDTGQFGG